MFGELSEEKNCVVKAKQIIIFSLYKADQSHSNKLKKKSSKIVSIDNYGFLFVKRTQIVVILNFIRFEDFEAK